MAASDDVYIALLRGINLAGRNMLPMKGLRVLFEKAGCKDVRSYIQSGNVVFRAKRAVARDIAARIAAAISEEYELDVPVVTRTIDELAAAAASNPFLEKGAQERALHVMFLADAPDSDDLAALDPNRSPGDEYVVRGREIYLHCPNGVAKTRLTNAYFDRRLGTTSTSRNWRTVNKLLDMVRS